MFYCEGKNCSRREQCAYHESFEWEYPRQYLDQSTNGTGCCGIDKNGNNFFEHRYNCGDKADYYHSYKALGWREGQEYKNSEGTICDDICLGCAHKSLCFCILEESGMVFQPGDRVRYNCEEIKANPRQYRKWLIERGWREELLEESLRVLKND